MTKYKVHFSGYYGYDIDVEAEDEDEAIEKAQEIDNNMSLEEWNEIVVYEHQDTFVREVNK